MSLRDILSEFHATKIKKNPSECNQNPFLIQLKNFNEFKRNYTYSDLKYSSYYVQKQKLVKKILMEKYYISKYITNDIIQMMEDYSYNPYKKSFTSYAIQRLMSMKQKYGTIKQFNRKIKEIYLRDPYDQEIAASIPSLYCRLVRYGFFKKCPVNETTRELSYIVRVSFFKFFVKLDEQKEKNERRIPQKLYQQEKQEQDFTTIVMAGGKAPFNAYVTTYKKLGYITQDAIRLANKNYLSNKPLSP